MKTYSTKYGDVAEDRLPITLRRAMNHIEQHAPDLRKKENKHLADASKAVDAIAKKINPQEAPKWEQQHTA